MADNATDTTLNGCYRVFISHGHDDRFVAKHIRELLATRGISSFLDQTDISIGDNFRTIILDELQRCDEVMTLLTPSSLSSAWVFAEIGAAMLAKKKVVAIRWGLEMEELHRRGVVSLVGDVSLTDLDHVDQYIEAVASRAGGHHND